MGENGSKPSGRCVGYYCYMLNDEAAIEIRVDLTATDDFAAMTEARSTLSRSDFPAAEVWHLARRVNTISKQ